MAYQGDDRSGGDRWRDREQGGRYGERALVDSRRFSLECHVHKLIACYREAAAIGAIRSARVG